MFLQLLKKKSQELNFTKIQGSNCRGNLKLRTARKEEKSVQKFTWLGKNFAIYYRKSKKKKKKKREREKM